MKFCYEYRTSDNVIHDGVICSSSREAAFAALKEQGIRPSKMYDAPGFFNKILGKGKRWIAIAGLCILAVFLLIELTLTRRNNQVAGAESLILGESAQTMRRQVWGDEAVIEKGKRTGWAFAFVDEGDRFLASFALPGVEPAVQNIDASLLLKSIGKDVVVSEKDSLEARQIKSIVKGMKDEAREYLSAGGGIEQYATRLVERQEYEISMYNRVKGELDAMEKSGISREELEQLWERRNDELRAIGVRPVPYPETL